MRKFAFDIAGFGMMAALATTPAFAGTVVTPDPGVAGGLAAMGMLGLAYRLLRRRNSR